MASPAVASNKDRSAPKNGWGGSPKGDTPGQGGPGPERTWTFAPVCQGVSSAAALANRGDDNVHFVALHKDPLPKKLRGDRSPLRRGERFPRTVLPNALLSASTLIIL